MIDDPIEDIKTFYHQAFRDFSSGCPLEYAPDQRPDTRGCLRDSRCAPHAWTGDGSRNASKRLALPITKLRSDVLRVLAMHRSPDSDIAGGIAINREGSGGRRPHRTVQHR